MLWRRSPSSSRSVSVSVSGGGGGSAGRCSAEEGVLEDAHIGGDRGVGPGGAGRRHGHVVRGRGAVLEDGVVARVIGHLVVVVVMDGGRGTGDGGCDWGRADLLEAHRGRLGLLLLLLLERRAVELLLVLRRGRGRGAGGELLDDVAELVLADVVHLRLRVRRARRLGLRLLLLRRSRRRRGFADVAAELVDAEVLAVASAAAAAAIAVAAAAAVHPGGGGGFLVGLAWAEERRLGKVEKGRTGSTQIGRAHV